jgi:hypothetical protein
MCAGSPNQFSRADPNTTCQSEVKSLFQNILRVSPCSSRFCRDPLPALLCKAFRMNILGATKKESRRHQRQNALRTAPKSLFQKILHVSPCGSRFYGDEAPSPSLKPLRMNILGKQREKMSKGSIRSESASPLPPQLRDQGRMRLCFSAELKAQYPYLQQRRELSGSYTRPQPLGRQRQRNDPDRGVASAAN